MTTNTTGPDELRWLADGEAANDGRGLSPAFLRDLAAAWEANIARAARAEAALERARALADELQHYAEGKDAEMSATMGAVVGTMRGIGDRLAAALSLPDGAR